MCDCQLRIGNTEPVDIPYKLLRSVSNLKDSWEEVHSSVEGGGQTCGTPFNSYSTKAELEESPLGKRIDYVMYRTESGRKAKATSCSLPLPSRIPASISAVLGKEVEK